VKKDLKPPRRRALTRLDQGAAPGEQACHLVQLSRSKFYRKSQRRTSPPHYLVGMLALALDVGGIEKVMFGSEHSICDPKMFVEHILNVNHWATEKRVRPRSRPE
jgi:hypothetical protein